MFVFVLADSDKDVQRLSQVIDRGIKAFETEPGLTDSLLRDKPSAQATAENIASQATTNAAFVLTCTAANAAMPVVDMSRPESVPISLMAQFYEVDFKDVKVDSIVMNDRGDEANVVTSVAGGHQCTMGVAKAVLSNGNIGWAVSSTGCVSSSATN